MHNIGKNVVYAGSKSNVIFTMINGRIIYDKGEFAIGITKEEIYAEANRILERIFA